MFAQIGAPVCRLRAFGARLARIGDPLDPGRRNHDGVTAAAVTAAAPKAHTRCAPVGEVCRAVLRWLAALVG